MTGELATVIDDLRSAPALCRPLYAPRPLGFVLTEAGRVLKQIRNARAAGNRPRVFTNATALRLSDEDWAAVMRAASVGERRILAQRLAHGLIRVVKAR